MLADDQRYFSRLRFLRFSAVDSLEWPFVVVPLAASLMRSNKPGFFGASSPVSSAFFGVGLGSSFRSAIPHNVDAMKYRQSPLATRKNMTPMKIIMNFIIFCCMALCSSVAGGVNNFC